MFYYGLNYVCNYDNRCGRVLLYASTYGYEVKRGLGEVARIGSNDTKWNGQSRWDYYLFGLFTVKEGID